MTRKKVKLAFITNDSARKATFKKRKKGLMKKVSELSTLCGIDACAIVYSPYEAQPEVWPDGRGAQRVLAQFKRMPEMEQSKKMVNQESFIRNRITKAADQLKKLHKDNREKEMTHLMYQCLTGKGLHGLAVPELNDMGWLLDQNLKEIYKRIDGLKKAGPGAAGNSGVEQKPAVAETGGGGGDGGAMQRAAAVPPTQQQWFTEWMGNTSDQGQMGGSFGHGGGGSGGGGGGGDEMIMPFNDGSNNAAMWSNVFFP
ncbi:agamous-like mads-box protein agl80 [Phtheirospermum japonicum]|uniref:Agamous-like mads-box protein agl80 n=1 Tax=Phtheirospermum japonicum TaxID=374723 RepID=A0A830B1C3_9LAMI|nr:agamous-like mads-box protein agl80 [Phtheirospermum japonicum]